MGESYLKWTIKEVLAKDQWSQATGSVPIVAPLSMNCLLNQMVPSQSIAAIVIATGDQLDQVDTKDTTKNTALSIVEGLYFL